MSSAPVDSPAPPPPTAAPRSNRAALVRLGAVVTLGVVLAIVLHGLAVLVVISSLIAMVMLHEAGHFATAKWSGMKVTEYFLGFGPRLWSVRRGETEYGIKAIPAGGYVRIVGMTNLEQVDPADEGRSYRQASFPRRLLVGVAGSAMHFVIAFGLLWGMCAFSGLPQGIAVTRQIAAVVPFLSGPSPAERAGLRAGDVIVAVDGRPVRSEQELKRIILNSAGVALHLTVLRNGVHVPLTITPAAERGQEVRAPNGTIEHFATTRRGAGVIGVDFATVAVNRTYGVGGGLVEAGHQLGVYTRETATGIADVFSLHGLGNLYHAVATAAQHQPTGAAGASSAVGTKTSSSNNQVLSPLGAAEVAVQAAHRGVSDLLVILVAINIFVGMVNLFPMLPLDGGHVLIACYERIRSRRGRRYHADVAKLMPVAYLFLALILLVGLSALYVNLLHPPTLG